MTPSIFIFTITITNKILPTENEKAPEMQKEKKKWTAETGRKRQLTRPWSDSVHNMSENTGITTNKDYQDNNNVFIEKK